MIGSNIDRNGKLSERQLDLIVRAVDTLPMSPAGARTMLELVIRADDANTGTAARQQAIRLAALDVALSARLIAQANRACPNSTFTVTQAVERLGFDALRTAVLSANLSAGGDESPAMNRQEFHRHCLAVAIATRRLAETLPIEPDEAFLCGLLHDMGKLALDAALPKSYSRVIAADTSNSDNIAAHERNIIGTDHTVFGRRLAEHWRLGPAVVATVWLHHQPPEALPKSLADRGLVGLVGLADAIARRANIGFSGNYTFDAPLDVWAAKLGVADVTVAQLLADLPAMTQEMFDLLAPMMPTTSRADTAAIGQAGAELTQLNERLAQANAALAGQAKAFDRLTEFAGALNGESSVAAMLPRIAATAADTLGIAVSPASPLIAYCADFTGTEQTDVIAARFTGDAPVAYRTLAPGASRGLLPVSAQVGGPAGHVLDALLARADDLADWADLAQYMHYPLLCAERWVGGIFYQPGGQHGGTAFPSCAAQAGKPVPPQAHAHQTWAALAGAMAMAMSIVQDKARAMRLSEQLAGASSVLMQTSHALAEARTMATIGEMAGGAAHEMNNPLAVISGRAQLMRDKAASPDDRKAWQNIVDQAHRISDIITDLMEFASPAPPAPQACDAGELLKSAADQFSFSDHTQAKAALVDIEIAQSVPPIWADVSQVQAAIVELIANAATAAGQFASIKLAAAADEQNRSVLLTVADNGPGMETATLERAFTPFFSQQRAGRRRGLGLPRAKRQIEANGGRIWIQSSTATGTKVFILLPASMKHNEQDAI